MTVDDAVAPGDRRGPDGLVGARSSGAGSMPAMARSAVIDAGRGGAAGAPALAGVAMAGVILAWGMGPPISKLISAPPLVAVFCRFWLSVPVLVTWLYASGHRLTFRLLRTTAPAGVLFGLNMICVFSSFRHASIATLSVMSALQPGLVLVVAGRFLGERPTGWHRLWTGVGIGGAVVVILGAGSAVRSSVLGIGFSTAALVTFTAYFVCTRVVRARAAHPVDAIEWMTGVTITSAVTVTPFTALSAGRSDFAQIGGTDWLWLTFAVFVTGVLGHVLMAWALRHIEASKASLYLLTMNVVAVAASWPIHHEPLAIVQMLGGAVVIGAVAAVISRPAPSTTAGTDRPVDAEARVPDHRGVVTVAPGRLPVTKG